MLRYGVNQHLIVLNLYCISINKVLIKEFYCESLTERKFDVKYQKFPNIGPGFKRERSFLVGVYSGGPITGWA